MMKMLKIVMRLSWRNLWRNHRRTLIMLATVALGVWAMIFMTALMRGMVNEMVRDAVKVLPGHVQVHHPDYLDDPNVVNAMAAPDGELLSVLQNPPVLAWSSRVRVPAVVSSARESRSVTLLGVNPQSELDVSFIAGTISAGRFLENAGDDGVILGEKLAQTLETGLGKRIVIMSQDPDNEIADRGFRIVGLFDASTDALEEGFAFTGLAAAQEFLGIGNQVHEIAIVGAGFRDVEPVRQVIAQHVGPGVSVLPWTELNSYLGTMLGVMDGFVLVWFVVVFMALAFGLVNTLVMAVFERVREIGLMLALGMKPRLILAQIVVESTFLLLIGSVTGSLLAGLTIYPLRGGIDLSMFAEGLEMFGYSTVLYPEMTTNDVLLANAIVILLGFIASLSPALRASRYQPVEALTRS
jgi:ABC-type lipoprotein release transport system permease subunit